jgi:hypothetical protein
LQHTYLYPFFHSPLQLRHFNLRSSQSNRSTPTTFCLSSHSTLTATTNKRSLHDNWTRYSFQHSWTFWKNWNNTATHIGYLNNMREKCKTWQPQDATVILQQQRSMRRRDGNNEMWTVRSRNGMQCSSYYVQKSNVSNSWRKTALYEGRSILCVHGTQSNSEWDNFDCRWLHFRIASGILASGIALRHHCGHHHGFERDSDIGIYILTQHRQNLKWRESRYLLLDFTRLKVPKKICV